MMRRSEKQEVINSLKKDIDSAQAIFLTNIVGISANDSVRIRKEIRGVQGKVVVTKNTFLQKAGAGTKCEKLFDGLKGPSAAVFVDNDAPGAAKILHQASKEFECLNIRGGVLNDKELSVDEIVTLANLPSRDQMLATLLATFNAPVSAFVRVLDQICKQKGGTGEKAEGESAISASTSDN